ncbi:Two component system response regulator [Desulfonema limicola]|uniref:Two component system response regulator n=1 Tax=Desulfonema limicola TaxID=45656 RepID=A0A975B5M2_9BACT|nr:response regulator [Desulfonema limicola]QTA79253.1 Two component system response regulator [Desulfonema limicola]
MKTDCHTVLCVDNEALVIESLKRLLRKEEYKVLATSCNDEGLKILKENKVHLVINVQKIPDMNKNGFLKKVKHEYPDIIRAILTGYNEADFATELVSNGYIDRFFLQPWYDQYFRWEIKHTLERYDLIQNNRKLQHKINEQKFAFSSLQKQLEDLINNPENKDRLKNNLPESAVNIMKYLPVPIIGVNDEQKIMIVNQEARFLPGDFQSVRTGKMIYEYLPDSITGRVNVAIHTSTAKSMKKCSIGGILFNIDYIPLPGQDGSKWGILVFRQL